MLGANISYELDQCAGICADGRQGWDQPLGVPPINLYPHIVVVVTITCMCKAIAAARPGPPRAEPFRGFRLEEYVADVVDQEALRQFRKCKNRDILFTFSTFAKKMSYFSRASTPLK